MKAYSGFIQIRAGQGTEKNKVFVKGYASHMNKADLYNYLKMPSGKTRTFKSIFTESCVKDMQNQVMHKSIFVDGMHETATNLGILNLAEKYGFNEEDKHDVKSALKMKRMPLAKVTEFDIDDNGLILGTETNPNFSLVDDEHKNYYEAVTGSLIDGYLKGYSINFDPVEFVTKEDNEGNEMDFIDKVNLYGVSYTDNPALADNQFTEVCMRSLGNFMKVRNVKETNDNGTVPPPVTAVEPAKVPVERVPVTEPVPPTEPVAEPKTGIEAQVEKRVQEELKKKELEVEQKGMAEQLVDIKKQMEELKGNPEANPNEPQSQSIVQQQEKYNQPVTPTNEPVTGDIISEKLKEITNTHNQWKEEFQKQTTPDQIGLKQVYTGEPMGGFGELMQLQAQTKAAFVQKPGEGSESYAQRMALLQNNTSDHMVVKRPMVQ